MITKNNYLDSIKDIRLQSWPEELVVGHQTLSETTKEFTDWSLYDHDAEIKEGIDVYFQKLDEYIHKNKAKSPSSNNGQANRKEFQRNNPRVVKTHEKEAKSSPDIPSNRVTVIIEEIKFIKRFVGLHDRDKSPNAILNFIKALQKAIVQKLIRKTSEFSKEINYIQKSLIEAYNNSKGGIIRMQIHPNDLPRYVSFAGGESVYASIGFMKRYIGLQGKVIDAARRDNFIKAIENAVKKDKLSEDPYESKVKNILKALKAYKPSASKSVSITSAELNGLSGIVTACGCNHSVGQIYDTHGKAVRRCTSKKYSDAGRGACSHHKGLSGFVSMDEMDNMPEGDTFQLPGALGRLLGKLERYRLAMTIEGDQGSGKTRLAYQIADAFADRDLTTGIFSLEIGSQSDLVKRMKDDYIKPENRSKIQITGEAAGGIATIRQYAEKFDVVIIDSWNKLGAPSSDFDTLRKDYPDTIWIVIFQRTTGGTIRGGTAPLYDSGINIEVVKASENFNENYAFCSKNRYGETGTHYNIANREIEQNEMTY